MYYAYNEAGKDLGPFTAEQLRSKFVSGEFPADKLIRLESSKDWQSFSTAFGIAPALAPSSQASENTGSMTAPQSNAVSGSVANRYRDAYVVARAMTTIGGSVKVAGIGLFLLLGLAGLVVANMEHGIMAMGLGLGALLLGIIVGLPIYVLGILLSAQGQVLKSTLDTAVYSSPFLTDDQRIKVMSLP